ncbi:MAG: hypothetical protein HY290_31675 [Planctomycetia bacterium]|nr:hypothetical protein [Planctomycetia bacterium]
MNALILLLSAALSAEPFSLSQSTYFNAETYFEAAVRGQSPSKSTFADESVDSNGSAGQTFAPGAMYDSPYDPMTAQPPADGSGFLPVPGLSFGIVGPQPYRFGWTSRYDVAWLPDEGVNGGGASGKFGIFELNAALRYTTGFSNLIFSWTPEFNYRSWSGPTNPGLPPNVFRFASDFELATPGNGPVSMQLGFTPAFVTDFSANPDSDAINWDARGVLFLRASPQWMFALGAAYWKRVDDIIIPYAGAVWTPNDYWELRLMFPKSRISYFLGNWWGAATWVYGGVEYNVEAYQIDLTSPGGQTEKVQLSDYRALFGLRAEGGGVTGFVEAGWVFARDVEFLHGTPGFDINTGFIGRIGLRF